MAQLNKDIKSIDSWLEQAYSDELEEGIDFVPLSQFTKPYISMDHAADREPKGENLEREVGRVFGILGHHLGELNRIKGAKKPAALKYRQLKAAISKLSTDAEKAGIKFDICTEPVEDDTTIIEEPNADSSLPVTEGVMEGGDEHEVEIPGYGKLTLGQIKAKIKNYTVLIHEAALQEKWSQVQYYAYGNGVLKGLIETIISCTP